MSRTISDFLSEYIDKAGPGGLVSFHMPGHKGRAALYEKTGYGGILQNIMTCDITEIPGADALFCPESTLLAVMENYAEQYGARHTELLVNGSSAGVMAAILSSVSVGGKLILARNSHHSAFSAMRLGGINPVYVHPKMDPRTGLVGEVMAADVAKACEQNPDAEAVLITSPNYYGMLSDISAIAAAAHDHGMILIVDQAHGAHLNYFDKDALSLIEAGQHIPFPRHSAEALGADIVINSTHKTLLSFTGSGIMNICSDAVSIPAVSDTLRMLQTTSPSYILMASLDINEKIMRKYGSRIVSSWRNDLTEFYRQAARIAGLEIAGAAGLEGGASQGAFPMHFSRAGLDMTKINISMAGLGISGSQLERELRHKGIISEMVHGDYVMLMTGAGNTSSDYARLLKVLNEIAGNYSIVERAVSRTSEEFYLETVPVPYEAELVPLYQADGRVLADPIIIYPPGTPVACPGEILTVDVISYISEAIGRGEKVTGVDDEGMIRTGTGY